MDILYFHHAKNDRGGGRIAGVCADRRGGARVGAIDLSHAGLDLIEPDCSSAAADRAESFLQ